VFEPNGPLSPSVYWRRRAGAAVVVVLAVALLAWIIGGLVGADDETPVQGTAGSRHVAAQVSASPSAPPSTRPSTTASSAPSSSGAPAPPATTTTTTPPPGPPQPCPDAVTKVDAKVEAPSYAVGQQPLLTLIVSNVGPVPCTRDVSRQLRELVVTSADGANRLWSSNDCFAPPGADVQLLQPQQSLFFSLNWAGRTSAPGCPAERTTVLAGSYRVVGKLGPLVGSWAPLTIT
jgi:hypothetical protein